MAYDRGTLYALAVSVGLPEDKANVAAAIGMAESGGNPNAHNTNAGTGDNSYGLWQINMLGSMGPARRALFGLKSNDDLFDPKTNARVMSAMSKQGKDFTPWSTYTRGDYKKYLPVGYKDLLDPYGLGEKLGSQTELGDAVAAARTATAALVKSTAWLSNAKNWVRVAFVVGGGILITVGVLKVASPAITKAVTKTAPGKVVKVVKSAAQGKGA